MPQSGIQQSGSRKRHLLKSRVKQLNLFYSFQAGLILFKFPESVVPFVVMEEKGTVQWNLNDTWKTITSDATGDPLPFIHWRKDNKAQIIGTFLGINTNGTFL